jgi:hypothetical protein
VHQSHRPHRRNGTSWRCALLIAAAMTLRPVGSAAQVGGPDYLRDRGPGIPTSMFGTYVRKGELLFYPFFEYYYDRNMEYEPFDFGLVSQTEYRGRYEASERLLFLGYGVSDRLALEFEAAFISARLDKSPRDNSPLPSRLEETGLGDVEGQVRWRWNRETATRPEYFSYFETVFPTGRRHSLIGTSDWQFKLGTGRVKGYPWGTFTMRAAVEYDAGSSAFGAGEVAFEYLKRLSNTARFFVMAEGTEDEWELVPEIQLQVGRYGYLKLGTGIGLTSKATDIAPEVGFMFTVSRFNY